MQLIAERIRELQSLKGSDDLPDFKEWEPKTLTTLSAVLGPDDVLVGQLDRLMYHSAVRASGADNARWDREAFESGRTSALGILKTALYKVEIMNPAATTGDAVDLELAQHVGHLIEAGKWSEVASQTAIFTESKIRKWAGLPDSDFGVDLMVKVFRREGGAFPLGNTEGEKDGWLALARGFVMAVSNPNRHRIESRADAKAYALGVVGLASLILTQLRYEHGNRFAGA